MKTSGVDVCVLHHLCPLFFPFRLTFVYLFFCYLSLCVVGVVVDIVYYVLVVIFFFSFGYFGFNQTQLVLFSPRN